MQSARDTDWLEEIRSYWAEHKLRQAEEAGAIFGCAQRAVAEAILGLDERTPSPLPQETSEPS